MSSSLLPSHAALPMLSPSCIPPAGPSPLPQFNSAFCNWESPPYSPSVSGAAYRSPFQNPEHSNIDVAMVVKSVMGGKKLREIADTYSPREGDIHTHPITLKSGDIDLGSACIYILLYFLRYLSIYIIRPIPYLNSGNSICSPL